MSCSFYHPFPFFLLSKAWALSHSHWIFQLFSAFNFHLCVFPLPLPIGFPPDGPVLDPVPAECKTSLFAYFFLFTDKDVLCNQVTQISQEQIVVSGSEVTLQCIFQTTYLDPDLYWYQIRPGRSF